MRAPVPPGELDRENCFLLFATFCGDIVRTAHAIGCSEAAVLKMCEDEGWHNKLAPILALKKSSRPGDVERACNRALNFVQAHKMRLFVARVLHSLTGLTEEQFQEYVYPSSKDKEGNVTTKLSTRALADLASAMEKCQALTYLALTDTAQDRSKRKESEGDADISAADMHAQIAAGFAAVGASNSPRAVLFDAQVAQAQAIVREAAKPVNPHDDDNH